LFDIVRKQIPKLKYLFVFDRHSETYQKILLKCQKRVDRGVQRGSKSLQHLCKKRGLEKAEKQGARMLGSYIGM